MNTYDAIISTVCFLFAGFLLATCCGLWGPLGGSFVGLSILIGLASAVTYGEG